MNWFNPKPDPRQADAMAAIRSADAAFEQAKQELSDAQEAHRKAVGLASKLRQIRERNHFGESLEGLYREKK